MLGIERVWLIFIVMFVLAQVIYGEQAQLVLHQQLHGFGFLSNQIVNNRQQLITLSISFDAPPRVRVQVTDLDTDSVQTWRFISTTFQLAASHSLSTFVMYNYNPALENTLIGSSLYSSQYSPLWSHVLLSATPLTTMTMSENGIILMVYPEPNLITMQYYNATNGKRIGGFAVSGSKTPYTVHSSAISPNGNIVVIAANSNLHIDYNTSSGQAPVTQATKNPVSKICFSPSATYMLTIEPLGAGSNVTLYQFSMVHQIYLLTWSSILTSELLVPTHCSLTDSYVALAYQRYDYSEVVYKLFNVFKSVPVWEYSQKSTAGNGYFPQQLKFSDDGTRFAVANNAQVNETSPTLIVFSVEKNIPLWNLTTPSTAMATVDISSSGNTNQNYLVAGSGLYANGTDLSTAYGDLYLYKL